MIRIKRTFNLILTLAAMLTMTQTAWAADETKTYAFSTMTTSNGNTISANDPEDNNTSKAIIIAQDGNSKISKVDFLNYIQIANMSGVGGTGADAEFLIYPHINGKVTQIVFTNVSRPSLLGSESFSMSIAGMKYNGTDDALTGVSSSQSTATFTSTNSEGISGNLTMTLSAYSQLQLNSGSEIRITYIPAAEEPHQHNFSFNASGNTLTATCAHDDGKECSLAGEGYKATLTLTANGGHYYPEVNYGASHDLVTFNAKTGLSATAGDITITNQDTSESTTGSVHDVGRYTATLTVTIDDTDYELRKGFSIHMGIITCDYPQFSFSPATPSEGDEVTITFTPQWGDESIQTFTMRGVEGNMSIGSGITDKGDGTYTFIMPDGALFVEATFSTPSAAHFAQDGDTYTIKSDGGWRYFCKLIKEDEAPDGFSGKTVKLDTSVGSSEMAGTSSHPFKGTFDGQGNTLTFNLQASEGYSAPFHYTDGATISNLHVEGTITGGDNTSLGGLVGYAVGNITIENCHVSTQISTTHSGAAWHGGVIAFWYDSNVACTVTGCVYDGLIYNPESSGSTYGCGGFVGCLSQYGHVDLTDCLFIEGQYDNNGGKRELLWGHDNNMNSTFFHRTNYQGEGTLKNCFFVATHFLKQGSPAVESATAPTNFAHFGAPTTDYGFLKVYGHTMVFGGKYYTPIYGDLVEEYDYGGGKSYNIVYDDKPLGIPDITTQLWVPLLRYKRTFTNGKPVTVMMPFNFTKSAFKKSGSSDGLTGHFYEFKGIHLDPQTSKWTAEMGEPDNPETTTMTANTPYLYVPDDEPEYWYIDNGGSGVNIFTQDNGGGNKVTPYDGSNESFRWNKWDFIGTYQPRYWYDGSDSEHPAENIGELGKVYGFAGATKEVQGVYNNTITVQAGEFVRAKNGAKIRPTSCYLMWTGYEPDPDPNAAPARRMTRGAAADEEMPQRITVKLISASGEITGIGTLDTKTGEVSFDSEAWYTLDGTRLSGKPTKKGIYIRSASGKNNGKKVVIK